MAKSTQAFKTSMTVMRGNSVPAYTLEYLTPVGNKKIGDYETIIVPFAEIGRDKRCLFCFGDDAPTVSRQHAAIEKREDKYVLIQLSSTNPTLVNGQPIANEWPLSNSDEIQLSYEGPKLRFNISESGTAGMGFTQRMGLVSKQILKPYKRAIWALVIFMLLLSGVGIYFLYQGKVENEELENQIYAADSIRVNDSIRYYERLNKANALITKIEKENNAVRSQNIKMQQENTLLKDTLGLLYETINTPKDVDIKPQVELQGKDIYDLYKDDVYFLEVLELLVTLPNKQSFYSPLSWTGAAFMGKDGRLYTSRHCIQKWRYSLDDESQIINYAEQNGGNVYVKFKATSQNNSFVFNYAQVLYNDSQDQIYKSKLQGQGEYSLKYGFDVLQQGVTSTLINTDWAYVETTQEANIEVNNDLSYGLSRGENIYMLAFSFAKNMENTAAITPIYSETFLETQNPQNGFISVGIKGLDVSNSGGVAFAKANNKFYAVGIVTVASYDDENAQQNVLLEGVIPIGNIK